VKEDWEKAGNRGVGGQGAVIFREKGAVPVNLRGDSVTKNPLTFHVGQCAESPRLVGRFTAILWRIGVRSNPMCLVEIVEIEKRRC